MEQTVNNDKTYIVVALDNDGQIKEQINSLHRVTRLQKRALIARLLELGINVFKNELAAAK